MICEWSPARNEPVTDREPSHAPAGVSVGSGRDNWHLCEACAALPAFARKRRRRPLERRST